MITLKLGQKIKTRRGYATIEKITTDCPFVGWKYTADTKFYYIVGEGGKWADWHSDGRLINSIRNSQFNYYYNLLAESDNETLLKTQRNYRINRNMSDAAHYHLTERLEQRGYIHCEECNQWYADEYAFAEHIEFIGASQYPYEWGWDAPEDRCTGTWQENEFEGIDF